MSRNLVFRADGKMVNVARKQGQLFVCATGCCCGHTDRGFAPVPQELYHDEWERRKLRNRVHLTMGGCLGPCALANVAMVLFDGRAVWFHSINSEPLVLALYDYLDQMLAADAYLPPPPALAACHFTAFTWEARPDGQHVDDAHRRRPAPTVETPGFLFLSHADTDLLALSAVLPRLPDDFPPVRAYNLLNLTSDSDVDAFLDDALPRAEVVVVRVHGGRASFAHGFDRLAADAVARGTWLVCLPGTDALDPELTALSNAGVPVTHEAFAYLQFGGLANYEQLLRFLADHLLAGGFGYDPPAPQPRHGVYHPSVPEVTVSAWRARHDLHRPTAGLLFYRSHLLSGNTAFVDELVQAGERAGINVLPVFAYSLKDEAAPLPPAPSPLVGEGGRFEQETQLSQLRHPALSPTRGDGERNLSTVPTPPPSPTQGEGERDLSSAPTPPPSPLMGEGGRGGEGAIPEPLRHFLDEDGRPLVDVVICTMSFAMGGVNPDGPTMSGWAIEVLERLDVPVLQAITAGSSRAAWEASLRGLSPIDAAMNVVLPEFDGRILTVPVSFKEAIALSPLPPSPTRGEGEDITLHPLSPRGRGGGGERAIGAPVVRYEADPERADRLMGMVARLAALRRRPNAEKRVAFVLTNSTARISRIGNAVGLDAPASLLKLFHVMQAAGYRVEGQPATGDQLLHALIDRCSYDVEFLTEQQLATAAGRVPVPLYRRWFEALPEKNRREMEGKWHAPPGEAYVHDGHIALAGLEFGNVFVALQPPRGYGMDPNAIYHMPDLPPTHNYHALYRWLRDEWRADAIVHLGKHGTLEWLPGKAAGPSQTCYPDQFLADLPLVYPFIINNPGEGAQAKRRTHAVIVDHMTPPMTTAGVYDELAELAQLVDEYYQVELLDPAKLPLLQRQIWDVIQRADLDADIQTLIARGNSPGHTHEWDETLTPEGVPVSLEEMRGKDFAHLLQEIDGYLCELAGAQIRDGLHILGDVPDGERLIDLIAALVRVPNLDVPGLRGALCKEFGLELDALLNQPGARVSPSPPSPLSHEGRGGATARADGSAPNTVAGPLSHEGRGGTTPAGSPAQAAPPISPLSHEGRGGRGERGRDGLARLGRITGRTLNVNGDVVAALDDVGRRLIAELAARGYRVQDVDEVIEYVMHADGLDTPSDDDEAHPRLRWKISNDLHRKMTAVARQFRKRPTRGEHLLWQALRRKQLDGVKFRRQQPIGPFVVDFYAPEHRLIVEVDGPIHEHQAEADARRQSLIESLDLRFVRIPTATVEANLPEALRRIRAALAHPSPPSPLVGEGGRGGEGPLRQTLTFVCTTLLPALRRNEEEIENVLRALDGRYVPAGPSGAPTRGMAHVLPTGRNFYAVDPRSLPSVAAWRVGRELAEELVNRYLRDEGCYPESVGLSIWGTSAMRTHGDDIAQVFALLGVRPRWQGENRRLVGIEVISLEELGRPRIDVVCRISGFFRDAFPYLISMVDEAVRTVAGLDEPPERNFVRKRAQEASARLLREGHSAEEAARRSLYRVFGCKPGTYGAGILPLIDERNWRGVADFAEAYVNWGGYAYTGREYGVDARPDFTAALAGVAVAVKNQDNREHDIFDSDDYLQYHGGMIATIRALTGRAPRRYFGDSSDPARAKVRDLKEEALRVFRTRVVNPKWVASVRRHGYKGGLELAATVDYLFGYDATADVVDDWMYERAGRAYVLDEETAAFLRRSNPWALRDIAGRLLEAADRGLWEHPSAEMLDALRDAYLSVEADIEARGE